ncbi:MAG: hypothetical protein EOS03_12515 [Mesorhizobium sp.]|uniref:hypothetical protein n=1 Tax=Mesorhizobium sp. TaxID=1871066 RepID=UPI000FE68356|nr:hypothetical protein [Mesorhizobium sp.]RWN47174.1 MAG: hypothetical protein EOS03_12515 [Mesorhizobium sp.]
MGTCEREGCTSPATHVPTIRFWAEGRPKVPHESATITIGIKLCQICGSALDAPALEEIGLVSDDSWDRIDQAMASLGKAKPDRASIEVFLTPIAAAKLGAN